ncbi:MAG TPA: dockerin type I domain-containing protein [Ruminococcus sp.]|nr:dockerin type I domain-containing protein [Ruminococcus sp.]
MRSLKLTALVSAASMAVLSAIPAGAANAAMPDISSYFVKPTFEYFNEADVNGIVGLKLPKTVSAHVEVTFDSPEGLAFPYYTTDVKAGGIAAFQIEGYSNTKDDYRNYHINIQMTGGTYNTSASPFTEEFTVPDINDDPDSFVAVGYEFKLDDKISESDIEYTGTKQLTGTYKGKEVTADIKSYNLHLNGVIKGDVTGEGVVDGSDATLVLKEFGSQLAGNGTTLDARQLLAADVDGDGTVDGSDATLILKYFGLIAANQTPNWDDIIPKN